MRKHTFKIGDKVKIPKQKTARTDTKLEHCYVINNLPIEQDYLFISEIDGNEVTLGINLNKRNSTFHIDDLEPYEEPFTLPEKWCVKNVNKCLLNKIDKIGYGKDMQGHDLNSYYFINNGKIDVSFGHTKPSGYTEITFKQFENYFFNKQTENKMRKITFIQAQLIIESACAAWKITLAEKWAVDIILKKNIEIDDSYYEKMRAACTPEQHQLFDQIFGPIKKAIEWNKLKTGSKVMIKESGSGEFISGCGSINNVDSSKPFDIVLFKTPYQIDNENKQFEKSRNYSKNITFHQKGNYITFCAVENTDYIIDVIEY